jgi:hypothetical protein
MVGINSADGGMDPAVEVHYTRMCGVRGLVERVVS